jgi:invasion protein IalB
MIRRWTKWLDWRVLLAAILLSLSSVPAPAQQDVTDLQAWRKYCNPDPVTAEEGCAIIYDVYANASTVLARVSLSYLIANPANIIASIWLPTGIFVDQGVLFQVDQNEPVLVPFRLCDPQICIAETDQIGLPIVNQMKAGARLTIAAIVPNQNAEGGAQRIDLPITLVGFTAAYDGPGLGPEEARAQQEQLNAELQARAEAARQQLIEQQQALAAAEGNWGGRGVAAQDGAPLEGTGTVDNPYYVYIPPDVIAAPNAFLQWGIQRQPPWQVGVTVYYDPTTGQPTLFNPQ